jgi:uncharacterized protein (TIGR00251 family)
MSIVVGCRVSVIRASCFGLVSDFGFRTSDLLDISPHPDGCILSVRVSAGASRDRILGEHSGALKVSVSAAPEKGKANRAVCELLAKRLHLPKSHVSVISGETSRDKRLLIRGTRKESLEEALKRLISPVDRLE